MVYRPLHLRLHNTTLYFYSGHLVTLWMYSRRRFDHPEQMNWHINDHLLYTFSFFSVLVEGLTFLAFLKKVLTFLRSSLQDAHSYSRTKKNYLQRRNNCENLQAHLLDSSS